MLYALGLATLVALYGLHRLALCLERRGWLYYVNRRPRVSGIVAFAAALDPSLRRMLEAQEQQKKQVHEDEDGDDSRPRWRVDLP